MLYDLGETEPTAIVIDIRRRSSAYRPRWPPVLAVLTAAVARLVQGFVALWATKGHGTVRWIAVPAPLCDGDAMAACACAPGTGGARWRGSTR